MGFFFFAVSLLGLKTPAIALKPSSNHTSAEKGDEAVESLRQKTQVFDFLVLFFFLDGRVQTLRRQETRKTSYYLTFTL